MLTTLPLALQLRQHAGPTAIRGSSHNAPLALRFLCSFSDIQLRTSLSRNAIKNWLKEPSSAEPKYQRAKTGGKLTAFEPMLLMALEADARRAPSGIGALA